jgi:hypothetical protein
MIIFDLDGTLADCEHRRHFVDPEKNENYFRYNGDEFRGYKDGQAQLHVKWKPDWDAFHEACDKDTPIEPVIEMWDIQISLGMMHAHEIWSGRSESVRKKTEEWLGEHLLCFDPKQLKMRPIGDYTPDDQLKERWLDEYIASMWPKLPYPTEENKEKVFYRKDPIKFVFDDRPKVIRMWQRRGIFVFNCNQKEGEF